MTFSPRPGVPHKLRTDDEYRGYYIPEGTILFANAWSIFHDEHHYTEPYEFRPERFLRNGELDPTVLDPTRVIFGFGPRLCPGRQFALNGLLFAISAILTCFNIEPAVDGENNIIPIEFKMTPTAVSQPEEFRCAIKPRSASVRQTVQRSLDGCS